MTAALTLLTLAACTEFKPTEGGAPEWYTKCTENCGRDTDRGYSRDSAPDDSLDTADRDEEPPPDLNITTKWSDEGVELDLDNATSDDFYFGMAETGAAEDGWYGEDCVEETESYGYNRCHAARKGGGFWETASLDDFANDDADRRTLFTDTLAAAGAITYVLMATDSPECWTWGDDPAYYGARFDCMEID